MVSPPEIEALVKASGMNRDEIVEPYPEWMQQNGFTFTFGWVLQRNSSENCIFLDDNRCLVYHSRPHICRTYPFMIDEEDVFISECPGCGVSDATVDAKQIKEALLRRRVAENIELEETRKQYEKYSMITGSTIVFDSNGAHEYPINPKNHDGNTYCRNGSRFTEKYR
jgi:Fe-S-cluster containining protein